jgi:hypothetical protein
MRGAIPLFPNTPSCRGAWLSSPSPFELGMIFDRHKNKTELVQRLVLISDTNYLRNPFDIFLDVTCGHTRPPHHAFILCTSDRELVSIDD